MNHIRLLIKRIADSLKRSMKKEQTNIVFKNNNKNSIVNIDM